MGLFDSGISEKFDILIKVLEDLVYQVTTLNHKVDDLNSNMAELSEKMEDVMTRVKKGSSK